MSEISYAVGIDVGGSSLKCGLVANNGQLVYTSLVSLKEARTEQTIISRIAAAINDCSSRAEEIVGVGIGFPGLVSDNVVIGGADNLPGFNQTPLGDILADVTGIPKIIIDNDANLMGLGELAFGAAKGCSDVVFLTVGTGIGGTIMVNGRLMGGYKNRGAELGHIVIQQSGLPCACGGIGCLEAYASVTALIKHYKELAGIKNESVDGRYIVEQYHQGEPRATTAMERHFDYMAAGITGFVNVFSPQKVVVGGGISESGQFYIEELERRVMRNAIPIASKHLSIVAAQLGNRAGLLGAASIAHQAFALERKLA